MAGVAGLLDCRGAKRQGDAAPGIAGQPNDHGRVDGSRGGAAGVSRSKAALAQRPFSSADDGRCIGSDCCWWFWASPSPCGRASISDAIGAARSPSRRSRAHSHRPLRIGPPSDLYRPAARDPRHRHRFRRMARLAGVRIFDRRFLVQAATGGALHERKLPQRLSRAIAPKCRRSFPSSGRSSGRPRITLKNKEKSLPHSPPEVLLIGPLRPVLAKGFAAMTVHKLGGAADRDAFLGSMAHVRAMAVSAPVRPIDEALLARLPKLAIISSFGVGYDHIDAGAAAKRGIVVTHTPDVLTEEVADTAIGLLLCTVRELPQAERYVRAGKWPNGQLSAEPRDIAQPHRRHGGDGAHRRRHRAPARGVRRADCLSHAAAAAGACLPPLSAADRHGARRRYADRHRARRRRDQKHDRRKRARSARSRTAL